MTHLLSQFRSIIFDYGGVLTFSPTDRDWQALAEIVGAPLSSFHQEYWRNRDAYDMVQFDSASYWRNIATTFGRELTDDDVRRLVDLDNQQWGRPNPNSVAMVRTARTTGLKVAVLSNIQFDMLSFVRKNHLWFSEFDVQVFSCELRIAKPSSGIFLHTAKLLGVHPTEALFIDDRQPNIDGAERVGMKTMLFESPDSSRELAKLLLNSEIPPKNADGRFYRSQG
ncbi:HAD family phosphatase [Telmatospirillum sp.]|uniref:HAD family hydrolase n=1 Tax=Telmatospirillum sp. TaxID=2079197 RepID=UPI002852799A|nr:HAD family phosphatase [Telmatospirillum sp.]